MSTRYFERYKPHALALGVGICVLLLINAVVSNPTLGQAQSGLRMMRQEADAVLANGGKVIDRDTVAKYGVARLGFVIAAEGWSSALKQRYINTLIERNWTRLPGNDIRLCKGSTMVTLRTDAGMIGNQSVNTLQFLFDGWTKKECAKVTTAGS